MEWIKHNDDTHEEWRVVHVDPLRDHHYSEYWKPNTDDEAVIRVGVCRFKGKKYHGIYCFMRKEYDRPLDVHGPYESFDEATTMATLLYISHDGETTE